MGTVFYRDQQGLLQGFNIAGDAPSPEEQGRINTVLSGGSLQPQSQQQEETPGIGQAFASGIGSLVSQTEGGLARMGQGYAETHGGSLFGINASDYARYADEKNKQVEEYNKDIPVFEGDSWVPTMRGLVGAAAQSSPAIAGGIAGTMVGGPIGGIIGTGLGAAGMVPSMFEQNVQEQKQANEASGTPDKPIEWGKASAATAAQSAVEYASDLVPLHLGGFLTKGVLDGAVNGAVKTLAKTGKAVTGTALSEGTEEAVQQAIQRWQAGEKLDDKEALTSYLQNAIVGGIIGGTVGGAFGYAGAHHDAKVARQMNDAEADVASEAMNLAAAKQTNIPAAEARRAAPYEDEPDLIPASEFKPFGLIGDRSQEQTGVQTALNKEENALPADKDFGPLEKPETSPFEETEYTKAVDMLRGEKMISPSMIESKVKVSRPKSTAIFQEMLKRNDAIPAGSAGQYAKVITPKGLDTKTNSNVTGVIHGTSRDYIVKPVDQVDIEPYRLTVNGKKTKKKFQTQDQAEAFAKANNLENYQIDRDPAAKQQYGIYSQHYRRLPNGEEQLTGSQVVDTYPTVEEANEAVKKYDPAYSPETNRRRPVLTAEEKAARIQEDTANELGANAKALQSHIDSIVGKGRAEAKVVPDLAGPNSDMVYEGSTIDAPRDSLGKIQKGLKQIVTVSGDLFNGDQNAINQVGTHEVVHVLRNADLLSKKEWDDLYNTAMNKKVPGKSYTFAQLGLARNSKVVEGPDGKPVRQMTTDIPMEEAIAEMLRYHFTNPTAFDKPVRSKLGKLVDFIRRIVGLSKRYNGDDVMQSILGGKIASREEGYGGLGPRKYVGSEQFSRVIVPPMYMKSDQFIQSVKQERAKPEQWKAIFKNSGIKQEEMEWLGINDWLDRQEGTVNKGDIADFIRANSLSPEEESFGGRNFTREKELRDQLHDAYRDDVNSSYEPFIEWIDNQIQDQGWYYDEAKEYRSLQNDNFGRSPYHESTTQPGGTNYKEWIYRLPQLQPEFNVPGHFGGRGNILVSARTKERTFDGKKYLFIEEIQSDLHQQGRRAGYITGTKPEEINGLEAQKEALTEQIRQLINERKDVARPAMMGSRDLEGSEIDRHQAITNEIDRLNYQLDDVYNQLYEIEDKVPNAPLKTNWPEFAFKRMLRKAVEDGYAGVAWHGEPESVAATERYPSIEEGVDERGNKTYTVAGTQPVTGVVNLYLTRLPSFAKKYVKQWGVNLDHIQNKSAMALSDYIQSPDDFHSLAAAIGMEGNPGLTRDINRIVQVVENQRNFDLDAAISKAGVDPKPILDFVKAWEVENGGAGQIDQHGNPIFDRYQIEFNDQMKDSVLYEGQPIWSAVSTERMEALKEDPNFQNWFNGSVVVQPNGDPKVVYHGTRADVNFARFRKMSHFGTLAAAGDRLGHTGYEDMANRWVKKNPIKEKIKGAFTSTPSYQRNLALQYGQWDDARPLSENLRRSNDWWDKMPADDKMALIFKHDPEVAERMRIYPAFLSIKNPIRIHDDGGIGDWMEYAIAAQEAGAITNNERARITSGINLGGGEQLLALLKRKGYDGFVYTNEVEDPGSESYIPFDAEQIKSVYNRGTWNKNDPRIDYSAVSVPKELYSANAPLGQRVPTAAPADKLSEVEAKATYNNLVPQLQKLGKLMPEAWRPKFNRKVEDTFIGMQDRMLPWAALIDRMKANGGFITNENDPYFREQLFSGQTDDALQQAAKDFYDPLTKAIGALPVTRNDVREAEKLNDAARSILNEYPGKYHMGLTELYLYARHATERNAEMRKRNAKAVEQGRAEQYENGSGMSDLEAKEILDWFDSKPFGKKFSDLGDPNSIRSLFRKVIAHTNNVRVEGQLTPEFRGTDADIYQDYAPLRDFIHEHMDADEDAVAFAKAGKGYNIRGNEDRSALGRSRLASNIIGNAILQNEEAIVRAGKNKVGLSVLQLVRDNPELMDGFAQSIESRPTKWGLNRKTGLVQRVPDNSIRTDPNVLTVKETDPDNPNRVKETYIRFKDDRLARALTTKSSLGNAGVGAMAKYLLKLNHMLGSLATSYNPEFMISNAIRDIQTAALNLSEYEMKGLKSELIRNVIPAMRGVYRAHRSGDTQSQWAKDFLEFRKNGGMTAFMGLRDLDGTIQRINKALREDPKNGLTYSKNAIKAFGDFIEAQNLAVENGTRLAAYKALRDRFLAMTNDPTDPKNIKRAQERAAWAAKNLTVNFNAGGSTKPLLNSLYLFYNASMQGSMALLNPMIRSAKMKKLWAGLVVAGLMQDMLMSALSPTDDDGLKEYDKIPDYILEHNIVLLDPFGLTKRGYIKLPMPYLMNAIYNTGRMTSKAVRGGTSVGDAVYSSMGTMIESLNPFGSGGNKFLNFVAPTVMDPLVDIATNTDFTGRHIAPEENIYGGGDKASQRYWNNTNPAYVTVADWLSRISGGQGKYIPGRLEFSPNTLEYWTNFVGGGAVKTLQRSIEFFTPGMKEGNLYDIVSGEDFAVNDVPFARRFLGNISTRTNTELYINKRDEVLNVLKEIKDAAKDGDRDRYLAVMQKYPDEYRAAIQVQHIETARKKLGRQINKIRDSKLPDEQKSALIKSLKDQQDKLVGRGNYLMRDIQ